MELTGDAMNSLAVHSLYFEDLRLGMRETLGFSVGADDDDARPREVNQ